MPGLSNLISYSGGDNGTYWDSAGVLQTSGADEARFTYRYNGSSWVKSGYLSEPQETEELIQNRDLSDAAWTKTGVTIAQDSTGLDGVANKAWTVTDGSGEAAVYLRQSFAISPSTDPYTWLWVVKKNNSPSAYPRFRAAIGGSGDEQDVILNLADGTFVSWRTGGSASVIDLGSWWAVKIVANNPGDGTNLFHWVYPAWNSDGSITEDVSATGSIVVDFLSLRENQDYIGSLIESGASATTRTADVPARTLGGEFNNTAFTPQTSARTPLTNPGSDHYLWSYDDETANNRIEAYRNSSNEIHVAVIDGGVTQADINAGTVADDTDFTLDVRIEANDIAVSLDNGTVSTDTVATIPTVTTEHIGCDYNSVNQWGSTISFHEEYPTGRSNSQLEAA